MTGSILQAKILMKQKQKNGLVNFVYQYIKNMDTALMAGSKKELFLANGTVEESSVLALPDLGTFGSKKKVPLVFTTTVFPWTNYQTG